MIVIAGAGIGGLTLGCALSRSKRPFRIFERAPKMRPVGAGIALSANALQALAHIGLAHQVRAAGHELAFADLCDSAGSVLLSTRLRDLAPGGTVAMTRTALQQTLLAALDAPVETGRAVVGYHAIPTGVRVRLADGEELDAELLVGADGLHSAVRRSMHGDEPVRYSGQTSWRGLVSGVELAHRDRVTESWGAGQRFGIVPVGPQETYWFAVADAPQALRDGPDPVSELRERFSGWHPPIDKLLAATPPGAVIRTDIVDRPPISRWVDQYAVLLGDAAHPMTPNLGMGACQAIEDAVILTDALAREADIHAALARYETRRIPRANSFVVRSFRFGRVAHVRTPALRWLRNRALTALRAVPPALLSLAARRDFTFRF